MFEERCLLDRFRRRLEVLRNQPVARHQPIKVMLRFANAEIINAWLRVSIYRLSRIWSIIDR